MKYLLIIIILLSFSSSLIAQSINISPDNLEKLKKNIVKIETPEGKGLGTGIVVGHEGRENTIFIISANHIFKNDDTNMGIRFYSLKNPLFPNIQIIERNEDLGIILLGARVDEGFFRKLKSSFNKIIKATKIHTESAVIFGNTIEGDWEHTVVQINQPNFDCEKGKEHKQKMWLNKTYGAEEGYFGGAIFVGNNQIGFKIAGIFTQIDNMEENCASGVKFNNMNKLFDNPFRTNLIKKTYKKELPPRPYPDPSGKPIIVSKGSATLSSKAFGGSIYSDKWFDFDLGMELKRAIPEQNKEPDLAWTFGSFVGEKSNFIRNNKKCLIQIMGNRSFEDITYANLVTLQYGNITNGEIEEGTVIAIITSNQNFAKMQVKEMSPGKVTFQWVTYEPEW